MSVIVYEGDYIRDIDGSISKVVHISDWDDNGDAICHLANGSVVNSADVQIENVLLESEVV
jgi:hypothetical protein